MKQHGRILTLLTVLAFAAVAPAVAGQTAPQPTDAPDQQQNAAGWDPISELNLTPEQRQQIRSIRQNNKAARMAIGERLREANAKLDEAMNADNPDEAVIDQRLRDVAAAQSAAMRMRLLTEVRIRRVLTVQQRETLRLLQRQARETRRERMLAEPDARQKRREERMRGLNQRNGLGPLAPKRENQRRP
jgi:Spy/CpxP family protein refolding chaperone